MQTENRLLDDLARAASGALGVFAGARAEVEARLRAALESWLKTQELVTREEYEAVKEMAANARAENERLAARIAALEAALGATASGPRTTPGA